MKKIFIYLIALSLWGCTTTPRSVPVSAAENTGTPPPQTLPTQTQTAVLSPTPEPTPAPQDHLLAIIEVPGQIQYGDLTSGAWQNLDIERPERITPDRVIIASEEPALWFPDGSGFIYVSRLNDNILQLVLHDILSNSDQVLVQKDSWQNIWNIKHLSLSPDQKWLTYTETHRNIYEYHLLDLQTLEDRQVYLPQGVEIVNWAVDSSQIYYQFAFRGAQILAVDPLTLGSKTLRCPTWKYTLSCPRYIPELNVFLARHSDGIRGDNYYLIAENETEPVMVFHIPNNQKMYITDVQLSISPNQSRMLFSGYGFSKDFMNSPKPESPHSTTFTYGIDLHASTPFEIPEDFINNQIALAWAPDSQSYAVFRIQTDPGNQVIAGKFMVIEAENGKTIQSYPAPFPNVVSFAQTRGLAGLTLLWQTY